MKKVLTTVQIDAAVADFDRWKETRYSTVAERKESLDFIAACHQVSASWLCLAATPERRLKRRIAELEAEIEGLKGEDVDDGRQG